MMDDLAGFFLIAVGMNMTSTEKTGFLLAMDGFVLLLILAVLAK